MKAKMYALTKPKIVTYSLIFIQVQNQICSNVRMGLLQLSIRQRKGTLPHLPYVLCQTLGAALIADKISPVVVLE